MKFYVSLNEPVKGKKLIFCYPNLMTLSALQNDRKLLEFVKKKRVQFKCKKDNPTKKIKKSSTPKNIEEIYGLDYDSKMEIFMQGNPVLKEILHKNQELPLQKLKASYYEKTELQGLVSREECIGFSYDYFMTIIHKIIKEGFFQLEIEDYIVFGHKTLIPPKKYEVQEALDQQSSSQKGKSPNSFYIFLTMQSCEKNLIHDFEHLIQLLSLILLRLEMSFDFLTSAYVRELETFEGEEVTLNKSKEVLLVEQLYVNFLNKIKYEDHTNLLMSFILSYYTGQPFRLKDFNIDLKRFLQRHQLAREFSSNYRDLDKINFSLSTLLIPNRKKFLKTQKKDRLL